MHAHTRFRDRKTQKNYSNHWLEALETTIRYCLLIINIEQVMTIVVVQNTIYNISSLFNNHHSILSKIFSLSLNSSDLISTQI